jgi:molybdenum cofactor cytidylyltransferase
MVEGSRARRVWGVVPAAGASRRMGAPKLLLDVAGQTVIARLVAALRAGGVHSVEVLVRADDLPLQQALAPLAGCCVATTTGTADMRTSVERLLAHVAAAHDPQPHDAWLLCPADHPQTEPEVVRKLLAHARAVPESIIVPVHGGRRGHPTLFPWSAAARVGSIPPGRGLNWLVQEGGFPVVECACASPAILCDLDTPEDYQRLREQDRAP